jgi:hypothetical protein
LNRRLGNAVGAPTTNPFGVRAKLDSLTGIRVETPSVSLR